jgi:hypothetical protein
MWRHDAPVGVQGMTSDAMLVSATPRLRVNPFSFVPSPGHRVYLTAGTLTSGLARRTVGTHDQARR